MSETWHNSFGDTAIPSAKIVTTSTSITSGGKKYIGADTTGAVLTVTIDSADIGPDGSQIIVKDEEGNAAVNNITLATEGAQTIDGSATGLINTAFGSAILFTRGGNLFRLD
ncbi:hypothetical protein LCGC14_1143610 [marine sediment metagenome]|uniref:Uncharacterized protein n=1 Tax=marine sediment metagenome TaxID=412755 RepID=A0A0F9LXM1_9ZZZZ